MVNSRVLLGFVAAVALCTAGCDKGLAPLNEPAGFSGVIHLRNWPPSDSVQELRVVAFLDYPSDSSSIFQLLVSGRAMVYPPIGTKSLLQFTDSITYTFTTQGTNLQVGVFNYIVIAQKFGSNIFSDWKPAAVYSGGGSAFTPVPVRVLLHRITPGIDFYVDFHNPPPKPWL